MNSFDIKTFMLGIVGAAIGGAVGYVIVYVLLKGSLYAPLAAPAALGYGAGWLAKRSTVPLGVFCAVAGLLLGLFVEWRFFPFIADQSLSYFITHIANVNILHLVFIAVGVFLAYRFAMGFDRGASTSA